MPACLPRRLFLAVALCAGLGPFPAAGQSQRTVTVFAAASLKTALDEVAAAYQTSVDAAISLSYGSSSALSRQIIYGAPAQIFVSANNAWMDALETEDLLAAGTRVDLLTNRLVLITGAGRDLQLPIAPGFDLAGALGESRLAMALVEAVPAGLYGRAALEALGVWASVEQRIAQTDNVRAALMLVALGEAPLGIVYATDAASEPRVRVLDRFPEDSHPPIVYPAALLNAGDGDAARGFFAFLTGAEARAIFDRHGFGRPAAGG